MDENVDLTLEALFAREGNPRLMLGHHYREHQRRTGSDDALELIDPHYRAKLVARVLGRISGSIPALPDGFDADQDWFDRHSRIFGESERDRIHRQIDPWAFVYDGSDCDRCGRAINPLTRVRNFGVCIDCNSELEYQFDDGAREVFQ